MTQKTSKKSGRIFFAITVLCVCGAIVATLLLANDKRNLRMLFDRYEIAWPFPDQTGPVFHRTAKSKRLPPGAITLPSRLFAAEDVKTMGTFVRKVYIPAPLLCDLFNKAGIENEGWKASEFDPGTFECLSERKVAPEGEPDKLASFFFIMKGTPAGVVTSMRIKLILPPTPEGDAMKATFVEAMKIFVDRTHWSDFDTRKIENMENLESSNFGINLKFSREFQDARRFNLIFTQIGRTDEMNRTRTYFDAIKWLPLSPQSLSAPSAFY